MHVSSWVEDVFGCLKPVIGVVHLPPLPGSPLFTGSLEDVIDRAVRDARVYEEAGFNGVIVENYGDKPYFPRRVPRFTLALICRVVSEVLREISIPVGVNVLRNDAISALSIAYAFSLPFIRVNILTETYVTDQGIISGEAHLVQRLKSFLGARVRILADVHVKHAYPMLARSIEESALDLVERGLADCVILTGSRTGIPPDREILVRVRRVVKAPIFIGSGLNPDNVRFYADADGFIVGSYVKVDGVTENPVDLSRARRMVEAVRRLR